MRTYVVAATLAAACVPVAAIAQNSFADRAGWMAGCWEQRGPGRVTMEMWMPPLGNSMMGASRTVMGAATREFEHLRISMRGDTLVYSAIPSGQTPTDFKSTTSSNMSVTFENRAHDFPQVITYRRVGADSLIARVEGPGPNNTTRGFSIPMRRVDCTAVPAAPPPPAPPPTPTDSLIFDIDPSPSGRQALFVKGWGQNYDIYVANPDGTSGRRLTDHAMVDYQPSWSPDGSRIAFVSARDGHQEIYTIRLDGSELTQLTRGTIHNSAPAWSPDGRTIAFQSERGGRVHLFAMNADGSNQRQLTRDSAGGSSPSWLPDGRKLLFSANRTGRSEVYSMNADASEQTQLTSSTQGQTGSARYSPDGRRIALWSSREGNDDVYVMNADGSNAQNISKHPSRDYMLAWSADGAYIYFRSDRDRPQYEIYRMRANGSEVTRITNTVTPPRPPQ